MTRHRIRGLHCLCGRCKHGSFHLVETPGTNITSYDTFLLKPTRENQTDSYANGRLRKGEKRGIDLYTTFSVAPGNPRVHTVHIPGVILKTPVIAPQSAFSFPTSIPSLTIPLALGVLVHFASDVLSVFQEASLDSPPAFRVRLQSRISTQKKNPHGSGSPPSIRELVEMGET